MCLRDADYLDFGNWLDLDPSSLFGRILLLLWNGEILKFSRDFRLSQVRQAVEEDLWPLCSNAGKMERVSELG